MIKKVASVNRLDNLIYTKG